MRSFLGTPGPAYRGKPGGRDHPRKEKGATRKEHLRRIWAGIMGWEGGKVNEWLGLGRVGAKDELGPFSMKGKRTIEGTEEKHCATGCRGRSGGVGDEG
jgi:hypothetical protein